jgi:hypothetical protein
VLSLYSFAHAGPYAGYTTTALIPFAEAGIPIPWSGKVHVDMRLDMPLSGHLFTPFVDTGSTGIIVPAKRIDGFDDARYCTPVDVTPTNRGWVFLSSSDYLYQGCWVRKDVYFNIEGSSNPRIKANVPVLAVLNKITCPEYDVTVDDGVCHMNPPTAIEHMPVGFEILGIGWGREDDS